MRRITMFLVGTVCGLVLLFSYRTSTTGAPRDPGHAAAPPGIVSGAPPAEPTPAGPTPAGPAPAGQDTVVNGSVAQTRWGPVQVQVRISGGRIVDVTTLQLPSGNSRDQEINSFAVPMLRSEVLAAQSARIDTVGGATVTSDGYRESLQAALDAAHFKS
jgi:uncharacterized protein with FMN-binding domain